MEFLMTAPVSPATFDIDGKKYMRDAKGALLPLELIKASDLLMDETTRKIMGFAIELSEQVARFKAHTFDDIGALDAIYAQEYGLTIGGAKGNKTLSTFDGNMKVEVRVQDRINFGPELQIAKTLVDECLNEWAADSGPEIRAIVTRAFNTDRAGQINRSEIFMMLRLDIEDPRWKEAMRAVRDAMRVVGSKTYVRCQIRDSADEAYRTVTIDLSKA
jgi:hypothetical protein